MLVERVEVRLAVLVEIADVLPVPLERVPVQRPSHLEQEREELLGEVVRLARRDMPHHLGLDDVDPGVDRVGEDLPPARLLEEPLDPPLLVRDDDSELQRILDEKTNPWGITVHSVEIRDVHIPQALEDAMSRQAQAERERQARIILGTAETEISSKFAEASQMYINNPVALHLRAMNMLYEAIKEKGSMVIVPSSAVETMGLGGMLGTSALARQQQ